MAAGVVAGSVCTYMLARLANIRLGFAPGLIAYAVVMLGVCLLACVIPARRALNVDAIAALRAD
jgi:ABC-type lipoprotein release transport system permease subunit